jgi:hypothetical protein
MVSDRIKHRIEQEGERERSSPGGVRERGSSQRWGWRRGGGGDGGGTRGATAPPAPGHVVYSLLASRGSTGAAPEHGGSRAGTLAAGGSGAGIGGGRVRVSREAV